MELECSHLSLHHADDLDLEVLQVLLVLQVEQVLAGVLRDARLLWPVPVTFDPSPFHLLRHHGHHIGLALPDHLPEGRHGGGQRALAGDVEELLLAHAHTDVAGVDVLLVVSDGDAGFVIWRGKGGGRVKIDGNPSLH